MIVQWLSDYWSSSADSRHERACWGGLQGIFIIHVFKAWNKKKRLWVLTIVSGYWQCVPKYLNKIEVSSSSTLCNIEVLGQVQRMTCWSVGLISNWKDYYYTLSHRENDRDITEHAKGCTLQDASLMHQSQDSFLNVYEKTHLFTCAVMTGIQ